MCETPSACLLPATQNSEFFVHAIAPLRLVYEMAKALLQSAELGHLGARIRIQD